MEATWDSELTPQEQNVLKNPEHFELDDDWWSRNLEIRLETEEDFLIIINLCIFR